jgi:hypothetical protein
MSWHEGFHDRLLCHQLHKVKFNKLHFYYDPLHIFLWTCNFWRLVSISILSFLFVISFVVFLKVWKTSFYIFHSLRQVSFSPSINITLSFWLDFIYQEILDRLEEKSELNIKFIKIMFKFNCLIYARNIKQKLSRQLQTNKANKIIYKILKVKDFEKSFNVWIFLSNWGFRPSHDTTHTTCQIINMGNLFF